MALDRFNLLSQRYGVEEDEESEKIRLIESYEMNYFQLNNSIDVLLLVFSRIFRSRLKSVGAFIMRTMMLFPSLNATTIQFIDF